MFGCNPGGFLVLGFFFHIYGPMPLILSILPIS